jgi:hypothetical protein
VHRDVREAMSAAGVRRAQFQHMVFPGQTRGIKSRWPLRRSIKTNTLASLEDVRRVTASESKGVSRKGVQVNYRWYTQNTRGKLVFGERTGFPRSRGKGPRLAKGMGPFSASNTRSVPTSQRRDLSRSQPLGHR